MKTRGQKKYPCELSLDVCVSPLQGNCCVLTLVGGWQKKINKEYKFQIDIHKKGVNIPTVLCSAWTCGRWYSGDSHCDVNGAENDSDYVMSNMIG